MCCGYFSDFWRECDEYLESGENLNFWDLLYHFRCLSCQYWRFDLQDLLPPHRGEDWFSFESCRTQLCLHWMPGKHLVSVGVQTSKDAGPLTAFALDRFAGIWLRPRTSCLVGTGRESWGGRVVKWEGCGLGASGFVSMWSFGEEWYPWTRLGNSGSFPYTLSYVSLSPGYSWVIVFLLRLWSKLIWLFGVFCDFCDSIQFVVKLNNHMQKNLKRTTISHLKEKLIQNRSKI